MNEGFVPEQRQASDVDFHILGKPSAEKRETMLILAIHAAGIALAHDPNFNLDKLVTIPYAGKIRLSSLFEMREE